MATGASIKQTSEIQANDSGIFPILLVNFIGVLGYSIVTPILIFIVEDVGGNGFIYGILGATYPLFQFIGAPILGRMSDRIGRRKVLILSQAGTLAAWILFFVALLLPRYGLWTQDNAVTGTYVMTLPLLLIFSARILDGFTGGNISVANAYLSDVSTDENRSKNFGKMALSSSLGFVVGPAAAGVLAATVLGFFLPIILAGIISLIAVFVIAIKLKDHGAKEVETSEEEVSKLARKMHHVEHKDCHSEEKKKRSSWGKTLQIPGIAMLFVFYFFVYLSFSLFYSCFPVYANSILSWTAGELGIYLTVSSLIMVVVQGPLLSYLSGRVSSQVLIAVGSLLMAGCFFSLSFQNIIALYIANVLLSVGNGLMWPSFMGVLASKGDKTNQGTIQGYGTSMGSVASMIGLVAGGLLFQSIETLVFTIGGIIFMIMLVLSFNSAFKSNEQKKSAD